MNIEITIKISECDTSPKKIIKSFSINFSDDSLVSMDTLREFSSKALENVVSHYIEARASEYNFS